MSGGIGPEKLIIQRVRQKAQGNPILHVKGCELPFDRCPIQAVMNMHVVDDVKAIIQFEERVTTHRRVKGDSRDYQQESEKYCARGRICKHTSWANSLILTKFDTGRSHVPFPVGDAPHYSIWRSIPTMRLRVLTTHYYKVEPAMVATDESRNRTPEVTLGAV